MIHCTDLHFNNLLLKISRLCFLRYMDGNFKLALQGYPFQQIIDTRRQVKALPLFVYCLMDSLEQAAYIIEVLNILKTRKRYQRGCTSPDRRPRGL